jgi:predicted  nucleic acid-binding Zn-ribbon protein
MHPDIQRLIALQAMDMRLAELRARLATFPQQLADIDQRVAHGKQQLAAAKDALTGSLKDRKKFEMDVESWKEKARKYRDQSFEVKTNEAYKALQSEARHAEAEAAGAEDRLLERMVAGESFEQQVKTAERDLAAIERVTQDDRQKLEADRAALQQELEAKEAERKQQVSSVPDALLQTYQRVAQRRHGIGLAEVRDEACSQCGVRIRPHVFQELRRDTDEIFQCETCTRILYYVERPPAAAAPVPPEASPDAPNGVRDGTKSNAAGATTTSGNER